MFEIIKSGTKINFVTTRYIFIAVSIIGVVGSLFLIGTKGLNYGIDFTGGAEVHARFNNGWQTDDIRSALEAGGVSDAKIIKIGEGQVNAANEYLIRIQAAESELNQVAGKVETIFKDKVGADKFEMLRTEVVGPAAGSSLRKRGFLAMFYALLAILVYVAVRFDTRYAPGAVIALFHDTVLVLGVFALSGKQFDLTILAAILALIGYSNNDTIVVFDRVRETTEMHPELKIEDVVNRSINETLGRTILTSLTTFFTVFALWFWGGSVLENFAFALMVGIVVGTYSSIFVASSLVIALTKYQQNRDRKYKSSGKKKKVYAVRPDPKMQG